MMCFVGVDSYYDAIDVSKSLTQIHGISYTIMGNAFNTFRYKYLYARRKLYKICLQTYTETLTRRFYSEVIYLCII